MNEKKIEIKEAEKTIEKAAAPAPKKRHRYTVKVEVLIPATMTYQLEASDLEEAIRKVEGNLAGAMQLHHGKRKRLSAKVFQQGTSTLLKTKSYR